jgi:hypothetical protein
MLPLLMISKPVSLPLTKAGGCVLSIAGAWMGADAKVLACWVLLLKNIMIHSGL